MRPQASGRLYSGHKLTAILLLICLTLCNTVLPEPRVYAVEVPAGVTNRKALPDGLNTIALPEEVGEVREVFKGTSDRTVILIQDAHAIPEAQRNIQGLIGYFQDYHGIKLVTFEGAASELDSQIFRSFPDQDLLKQTLSDYFDRAELSGGAAAAILNESESDYYGVEDWGLYEQGLPLYLAALDREAALLTEVDGRRPTEKRTSFMATS